VVAISWLVSNDDGRVTGTKPRHGEHTDLSRIDGRIVGPDFTGVAARTDSRAEQAKAVLSNVRLETTVQTRPNWYFS